MGMGMTPAQFRAALEKLGLSQVEAAEFLGVSTRAAHGYANGWPIREGDAKLLRLMVKLGLKPEEVK
jgi:predicted transcriptional regulator